MFLDFLSVMVVNYKMNNPVLSKVVIVGVFYHSDGGKTRMLKRKEGKIS